MVDLFWLILVIVGLFVDQCGGGVGWFWVVLGCFGWFLLLVLTLP